MGSKPHSVQEAINRLRSDLANLDPALHGEDLAAASGYAREDLDHIEEEFTRLEEQLETARAMCRDIVKRNPPSAFIDTWATVNKAQEFLASFPASEPWAGE